MRAGDHQMGLVSNMSSESTLVNPSSPAAPPPAPAIQSSQALDLNSPPPSAGSSRSSSSTSSSSPPRSSASAPPPGSPVPPAAPPASTARKPATPSPPPQPMAQIDPDPLKQQLASTTFIQADVLSFREVVQRHTGAAEDAQDKMPVTLPARQSGAGKNQSQAQSAQPVASNDASGAPHGSAPPGNPFRRHHMSRLHERKVNNLRNLEVSRASPFKRTGCSPRGTADGPSPKLLYAASGMLPSPVTPLSSDASFETTSNPSPVQHQMPLTPTETLRREFASSLHCGGGDESPQIKVSTSSPGYVNGGGVLERFPFLHHHQSFHQQHQQQQSFHHHHHQQQQQMNPVVNTGLQLGAHYQQQQQQNHHMIYEQHQHQQQQQIVHQQNHHIIYEQHQQMNLQVHQREPELLDLFPVHATSLKESRC